MTEPSLVAVQATEKRFYALTHQPGGTPLDETGKGDWPADSFTFSLIREGALKRAPTEDASDDKPATAQKRS